MRKVLSVALAMVAAAALIVAQDKGKGGGGKGGAKGGGIVLPPMIKMTVAGTQDLGAFPAANAGQGKSPAISWSGAPAGTVAFALLFHDPDPAGPLLQGKATADVTHWLVYNIPGTVTSLPANFPAGDQPDGTKQGGNITGQPTYMGPGPPAGHGPHHYTFELWALSAKIEPTANTRDAIMAAMDGKVLAKGYMVTTFENK
ncbi:MAG: YbhB/YbcL family Raf kinase inhibitor-like protein [Acidobacteriota bacterium]